MRLVFFILFFISFFPCLWIFTPSELFAQQPAKIDSILHAKKPYNWIVKELYGRNIPVEEFEKALAKEKNDNMKVKLINVLCWKYFNSNPQKALEYAKMQVELAEKLNDIDAMESGYDDFGFLYTDLGDYEKSLSYHLKSLKLKEEKKDSAGITVCMNGIGDTYFRMDNFSKALEYMLKSLQMDSLLKKKNHLADHYGNIGVCYANMNQYDKALFYYLKAERICKELKQEQSSSNLMNTGIAYQKKGELEKAGKYLLNALAMAEREKDVSNIVLANIALGDLFSQKKEYAKAMQYAQKGLALAKEAGLKDEMKQSYSTLSDASAAQHDYKNAYNFHKLYSDSKDSLLNEESSKQITEMQTKYETEKKEQQITLLNKEGELQKSEVKRQKIIIWSVAAGLFIVLILSVFIFRERRKSEKLLLNILPAETARELKANGKATAKHYESVTVMFTDFKGFTTIAEKLSAEELVSELDFLFRKFDEIISKYPIEKIKTIGDAYMCAGGLPTANSTNAMDVVSAALEIQEWMKERQEAVAAADNTQQLHTATATATWSLRIGIHTGPVTAGVVGDKKFAYDIWGDTVNTASRMESSGEAGKINISGATYELLKHHLTTQYSHLNTVFRGKIPAKNKGEIEMYFVNTVSEC